MEFEVVQEMPGRGRSSPYTAIVEAVRQGHVVRVPQNGRPAAELRNLLGQACRNRGIRATTAISDGAVYIKKRDA